ncbi:MAG: hydrogenase expression/formation protein HypE [Candidatus Helarchaeota archaeon]
MPLGKKITLSHGAGGSVMGELIEFLTDIITEKKVPHGIGLPELDDGGTIPMKDYEIVFTTDAHAVSPIFYPGGDIGRLSISGTVNDVLVMGAKPIAIADTIVIEEGFEVEKLKRILESMNTTAKEANVKIIAGDVKVVPHGDLNGILISTSGIGIAKKGKLILDSGLKPGNKIIVTGTIGDHGIAILANREGMKFETPLKSDTAPLSETIGAALKAGKITAMKDPTRGGVATALNEFTKKSNVSIWLWEEKIPIRPEVTAACEMFGMDPFEITCEGKAIIGVDSDDAENVLCAIRKTKYGENATIIGEVKVERPGNVIMRTKVGGHRIIDVPYGEPIPRVC